MGKFDNKNNAGNLFPTSVLNSKWKAGRIFQLQQKIIKVVKRLEEEGTIVIAGAGGGDVV